MYDGVERKVIRFKIVLVGESGVGKSSMALKFVTGQYRVWQQSTVGAAYLYRTIQVDGLRVRLEIWDTAGQERYRSLIPMYYRKTQAAVVVYDISKARSFERAKTWVDELKQDIPEAVLAFSGNKSDLSDDSRAVEQSEAEDYARENDLLFFETSAVTGMNIEDLFRGLAEKLLKLSGVQIKQEDSTPSTNTLSSSSPVVTISSSSPVVTLSSSSPVVTLSSSSPVVQVRAEQPRSRRRGCCK